MLEINNYNSAILHNITFSLKKNENLIILGENGAGKSTLAKVLSNLITNNSVKLFGENIWKVSIIYFIESYADFYNVNWF